MIFIHIFWAIFAHAAKGHHSDSNMTYGHFSNLLLVFMFYCLSFSNSNLFSLNKALILYTKYLKTDQL